MKNQQEQIKNDLTIFWQSLSIDVQKKIGQEVTFIIWLLGTSITILDITREKVENLWINSNSFQEAIRLFEELTPDEKLEINSQLSGYFLSRNK